ncbi:hypothetical protein ACFQV8_29235 [Pseudonocardia benzenivorans]
MSVTPVPDDVPLTEEALREYLTGRDAYRRTRFVVARRQGDFSQVALLHVEHDTQGELFSPVTAVTMLARPDECTFVVDESVDTGIPSDLVRCARERAPHARVAVIQGRYAHISFVLEPRMLHVGVREVVPPEPAKLLDQARRILAVSEQLPPMDLVGQLVDLADLAAQRPDEHYLLPCRGSGGEVPGATVSYLDEHPRRPTGRCWAASGRARSTTGSTARTRRVWTSAPSVRWRRSRPPTAAWSSPSAACRRSTSSPDRGGPASRGGVAGAHPRGTRPARRTGGSPWAPV